MARKVYVSFKAEDIAYKDAVLAMPDLDCIHKSLNTPINSTDPDYILQKIRDDYLSDSTVTVHLIGLYGAESRGAIEQQYIKGELQSSLYNAVGNTKSGVLGVVLPDAVGQVFKGTSICGTCGGSHNVVVINDQTTVSEFSYNYYIPHNKCAWAEEDRYCVLTTWESFSKDPTSFVESAYEKRSAPIASRTKVRP